MTAANTGNASLFINSAATRGADPLDFIEVGDGCSGLPWPQEPVACGLLLGDPSHLGTSTFTSTVTDAA